MRFTQNLFLIVFLAICFYSCKKDPQIPNQGNNTEDSGFNCGRSKFIDTISANFSSPAKIGSAISGKNNLYVYTIGGSNLEIIKLDCDANFLWKKVFAYPNEKVISVISEIKGDNFYVLTATDNFTSIPTYTSAVKAWVSDGEALNPTNTECDRGIFAYTFNPNYKKDSIINLGNYSRVNKYNASGNFIWQVSLNGNFYNDNFYNGNGLCLDTINNLYVLTATKKGCSPFKVDSLSGTYPAYATPLDSNSFSIVKLDSNGNQLLIKSLSKIKTMGTGFFNPFLSISANHVSVRVDRQSYIFDNQLNFINKISQASDLCVNKGVYPLNNPKLKNLNYFIKIYDGITTNYYYENYFGGVKINSTSFSDNSAYVFSSDDYGNIYLGIAGSICKYNIYGVKQYSKVLPSFIMPLYAASAKARQPFFFIYDSNGKLYIVKPDFNGNY